MDKTNTSQVEPVQPQQIYYPPYPPQVIEEDEIDLIELWQGLVEEKWTIFTTLFIVILAATGYLYVAKPYYQSSAFILPAKDEDIRKMQTLDILLGKNIYSPVTPESSSPVTPESSSSVIQKSLFQKYVQTVQSKSIRQKIFNQNHLEAVYAPNLNTYPSTQKQALLNHALENFSKNIKVVLPKKKKTESLTLEIQASLPLPPEKVSKIVNQLTTLSQAQLSNDTYQDQTLKKLLYMTDIKNKISGLKSSARKVREDRIARLQEAIKQARLLGYKEPQQIGLNLQIKGNDSLPAIPTLGYRLLEKEKQVLEQRKTDEPFIDGLRELQTKLAQLEQIRLEKTDFKNVVQIDQKAAPALKPAKPKKALILVVSAVTGLILGIFIALIRRALKNRKQTSTNSENNQIMPTTE